MKVELLNTKPVYMVEAILLATIIFEESNFQVCIRHTLNLAIRLGLKTESMKFKVVKERIGQIWANRTTIELDVLFNNNLELW